MLNDYEQLLHFFYSLFQEQKHKLPKASQNTEI